MSQPQPPAVDWGTLNRQFYASNPTEYFRERLNLLLLRAGRPKEVQRLLEEGVRYDGLISMTLERSAEPADDAEGLAFLITESQAILHHASEALLRLFLAHLPGTPCPWFEIAHLRDFRKFKAQVEPLSRATWPEGLRRSAGWVFLGCDMTSESVTQEQREAHVCVVRLLRLLAGSLLSDSNLYNSVKHGMAVISGPTSMTVTSDVTGTGFGHAGASVIFLESKDDKDNGDFQTWHETTRWVSVRRAMFLAQLAIMEIDALWAIARCRYVGAELAGVQVVTRESLDSVITGDFADAFRITRFSRSFAVKQRPPRKRS